MEHDFKIGDLVLWKRIEEGMDTSSILYKVFKRHNDELADKWSALIVGVIHYQNKIEQLLLLGKYLDNKVSMSPDAILGVQQVHYTNVYKIA